MASILFEGDGEKVKDLDSGVVAEFESSTDYQLCELWQVSLPLCETKFSNL